MGSSDADAPHLVWSGKGTPAPRSAASPLGDPEPADLATVECYRATEASPVGDEEGWENRLVRGDNATVMPRLLRDHEGEVDLVYLDPPFATGADRHVSDDRGGGATRRSPLAYRDTWQGGLGAYLSMLQPRLALVRDLLAPTGSVYVHLDANAVHYVKVLMDEVFGPASFQREIVWRIGWVSGFKAAANNWVRNHDTILYYVKDPQRFTFNKPLVPYPVGYRRRDGQPPRGAGQPIDDVWNAGPAEAGLRGADSLDSIQIKSFSREKTGYPTQKNESLLARIVAASSHEGDLVADPFAGSGTTAVVAERLGRRWLAVDVSPLAVHTTRTRLLAAPRRRPFRVEVTRDRGASAPPPVAGHLPGGAEVEAHAGGAGLEVRLTGPGEGWSEAIAAWSVGTQDDRGVFTPSWWSARMRSSPELMLVAPPHPLDEPVTVQVTDRDGLDHRCTVEAPGRGREVASP